MIQFGVLKYGIHKKVKDKSQQIRDDSADSCSEDDNNGLLEKEHPNVDQSGVEIEAKEFLKKKIEDFSEKQIVEEKINSKIDPLEPIIVSDKMVDGKKELHQREDLENNNNCNKSEIDAEHAGDDEHSDEATTPTSASAAVAAIAAAFVPGHVTLETLQNTKVAVAQFAANTLANNPDNETALKELAMLQSTLFTLQHQQVFQMQLIHQLQSQLSMGQLPKETEEEDASSTGSRNEQMDTDFKDEEDEDDEDNEGMEMPVEVNIIEREKSEETESEIVEPKAESLVIRDKAVVPMLKEPIPNHKNSPSTVQPQVPPSVNQPPRIPSPLRVPQHCHISALTGIITNHDPPPSLDEPNSLEMLQKRAQEVLDSASQGLLAGNLADELAFRKDKQYSSDGKGKNEPFLKHRCRYCGKVFGSDSALQIHLRSHTGERPFKCNVCGSRFTTKGNLKVHFQRHTSNFPHVQMNPNPIPEHLDKYHPPLLAQLSPGAPPQHPQIPHSQSISVPISASSNFSGISLYRPPLDLLKSMGGHPHPSFESDTQDVPADLSKPISPPTPPQQEISKDLSYIKMEPEDDNKYSDEDADEFIQHEDTESPEELEERLIREAREEREEFEKREREEMERLEIKKQEIAKAEREEMEREHKLQIERQRIMAIERELFLKRERQLQLEEAEKEEREREEAERCAMISNYDENSTDSKFSDHIRDSRSEQDQPENLSKSQPRSPSSRNSSISGKIFHGGPLPDPTKDPVIYTSLLPRPGSNDNSWESLIEVTKTSTTSQLQKLVDNIEQKLTDPNQCIVCHQVLSCKSALQMHYRTHTGERPFRCRICGRAFTTKGNLKTHMGVHRMKPPIRTPHQCPVCHKKYSNALVLQQHIRMHTGEPTDLTAEQIQAAEVREFPSLSPGAFPMGIGPFGFPFPGLPHNAMRSGSSQGDIDDFMEDDEEFDDDKSNSDDHNNTENESINSQPGLLNMSRSSVDLENHVRAITTMASQLSASELNKSVAKARTRNEKQFNESNSVTPTRSSPTPSDASQGALDLTPRSNNNIQTSSPMLQGPSPLSMFPNFPMLPHGPVPTSPLMRNALNSLSQSVMPNSPFNTLGLPGVRGNTTCNICFKTFACNSALDIHYRSHTKERPFKCTICDRGFSTKSEELAHTSFHLSCRRGNMKQHMLTHKIRDMPNHMFGGSNSNSNSSDGTHMSSSSHQQSSQSQSTQQQRQQSPHFRVKSEVLESSSVERSSSTIFNHETEKNKDQQSHNNGPSVLLEPVHIKQEPGLKRSPSEIEHQPLSKRPSTIASGPQVPPFLNPGGAPSLVQTYIHAMSPRYDDTLSPIDMTMQPLANSSPVHHKNNNETKAMPQSSDPVRDSSPNRELNHKLPNNVCSPEFRRDDILSPRPSSPNLNMEELIGESPLAQLSHYQQQYHQQQQEQQKLQQQKQQEQLQQQQLIDAESPNSKHLCTVCRKNFSSSSALQIHMRTHTGDKPFRCSVCEKAFTTKGNLKVHMGTHMWSNAASRRGRRMSLELPLNRPLPLSPQHSDFLQRRPELFYPYLQAPFLNGMHQKLNEMNALQHHPGHGVSNLPSPQHNMTNKYAGYLGFNGFLPGQNREIHSPSPSPVSDRPPSSISPTPNGNTSDLLSSPPPSQLSPQSNGIESTQLKATIPSNPSLKRMWDLHYDRKQNDGSPAENSTRKSVSLLTPSTCREGLAA